MRKYTHLYRNPYEDRLNLAIINKEYDKPLIEYIKDVWLSLQVVKQIKIKRFEWNTTLSTIDSEKYIFKREKRKKKKDRHKVKFIENDRCGALTVYFDIVMHDVDPKTGEETVQVHPQKKTLLIPIPDEQGYIILKNKKFYMIYQLLEKSTYTSSNSVTLKSLMPVDVMATPYKCEDINETSYSLPSFKVTAFKRSIPILYFYLSKGLHQCIDYLGIRDVITFIDKLPKNAPDDLEHLYFPMSTKCWLQVNRHLFEKHFFIQSMVGSFMEITNNRVTLEYLDTPNQWIKKIANPDNLEKGMGVLTYFNRMLDRITQSILKLDDYNKGDIYDVLRVEMQNYPEYRLKDNCDMANKRLRCNECMSALLTKEFSRRLNRIISMGKKATVDNIKEIFKFSGDLFINLLHKSGILRSNDVVNDMTFWTKLKYTSKGPHSLGNTNSNNISVKYRNIDPSMIGYVDLLVCSNSDPGMSGVLTPFNSMKSMHFDESTEPSDFYYNLIQDLKELHKKDDSTYIICHYDNPSDFYKGLEELKRFTNDNISISATSREGECDIVINELVDMDDLSQPQTVGLLKKKRVNGKIVEDTPEETEGEID